MGLDDIDFQKGGLWIPLFAMTMQIGQIAFAILMYKMGIIDSGRIKDLIFINLSVQRLTFF